MHTDLQNNGLIPDLFYGLNEHDLQWIENENWAYRARFNVNDELFKRKHIELVFKGLDTYAEVYLNDVLILKADNMFRTWRIDCKDLLKKENNILRILFRSPLRVNRARLDSLPYHLPAGNDRSEYKVSVFTRKAPYHFGWDWGPRFVTCGVWRPIEISAWDAVRISDFQIYQQQVNNETALLKAVAEIEADHPADITIRFFNGGKSAGRQTVALKAGKNRVEQSIRIHQPKLWWTNGLGQPHLYTFSVEINSDEQIIDRRSVRFGIRTIEVVQQPDSAGKSFYFKLNGIPVFMKGANYIPQDSFLPRVSAGRYREIIRSAKEVGMNMLRVWGGGVYEDDLFYDLCDENGILVWQDFMFACSMYPGYTAFMTNVRQEVLDNVLRLRNHPSIALWCGNNEMQIAWERWGYQKTFGYSSADSAKIYGDYLKLFHELLPQMIQKYDPGRFYWPSSPNSAPGGWAEEAASGDLHYWGVWWGKEPFSAYEKYVGRFVSEYGFQSLPAYSTIERFTPDSARYLVSSALKSHNKHPVGFETIEEYMRRDFKVPQNLKKYTLISQILQAEGMKTAIEAHRRARPYCMGTLYWQFNDCWPVVSWSGIDYYGNWKAFHYYLRRLYAPVLISPVYKNGRLDVYLVSDLKSDKQVRVKWQLMDFYGSVLWQGEKETIMPANSSSVVFSGSLAGILNKDDSTRVFLHVRASEGGRLLAEGNLFFAKMKNLRLPEARISVKTKTIRGRFALDIRSETLVKNFYLDYTPDKGVFSDNYFDLLPGRPKTIRINLPDAAGIFRDKIRWRSDLFR